MNTTARVEGTGKRGCVHLSQETADLLIKAGKGGWIEPRDDLVEAKGKGKLQTYWLKRHLKRNDTRSTGSREDSSSSPELGSDTPGDQNYTDERIDRLVSCNHANFPEAASVS